MHETRAPIPEQPRPRASDGRSLAFRLFRVAAQAQLLREGRFRVGAVVAVAALIGLIVWLTVGSRSGSHSSSATTAAVAVSYHGLQTIAGALNQPTYWVGARPGTRYEFSQTADGRVYVRYLPKGLKAGDRRPLLTVGTYSMSNAFAATQAVAREKGTAVPILVGKGGVAFYTVANPTNSYLAYPGSDYQVEVFSPAAGVARLLVASGKVALVPGSQTPSSSQATPPTAVSIAELKARATSLGRPIYWLGPRPHTTYELTVTANGQTFIRYLPENVPLGDKKAFLTVAMYPMQHALAVVRASASGADTVTIKLAKGGTAVYSKQHPTSVYAAFPGSDVQIEVYDPLPTLPAKLVRAGDLVPVG